MSDTTKRGELLVAVKNLMRAGLHENTQEWTEFYTIIDPLFAELSAVDQLRERLAAVEAERDVLLTIAQSDYPPSWVKKGVWEWTVEDRANFVAGYWRYYHDEQRGRAERAERILAVLREPSKAVKEAFDSGSFDSSCQYASLRKAGAAAEQEVDDIAIEAFVGFDHTGNLSFTIQQEVGG